MSTAGKTTSVAPGSPA
jgi:small subunit ribosomal protein S11